MPLEMAKEKAAAHEKAAQAPERQVIGAVSRPAASVSFFKLINY